jgi:high affinity Mn2+ porin
MADAETQYSLTSTLFIGAKLWKGAEVYINPEIAGGGGLSGAKGIAGFTNGEAFRVGNPAPKIYLARGYFRQTIALGRETEEAKDAQNQIATQAPIKYLRITAGKFSLADFFDANAFSHDPRSQFLNWALMDYGAWDFASNVRGYTVGYVAEFGSPHLSLRFSTAAVPTEANGAKLNEDLLGNFSNTAEVETTFGRTNRETTLRVLGTYTKTQMGNYAKAIKRPDLDITETRKAGRTKYNFGISLEQKLSENGGIFFRYSYNDGKNETWSYTEIDQSLCLGYANSGTKWKRDDDTFGIAVVANALSNDHRDYLAAGGYGFMIGDGKLNYGYESIVEVYYKINIYRQNFFVTPDYQFIMNPGYNKDRGPATVFTIRLHAEF